MEYKLESGKIKQTVEIEIKPQEVKAQLSQLKQREAMIMQNLVNTRLEITKLEASITKIKTETGVEVLLATPEVAEEAK